MEMKIESRPLVAAARARGEAVASKVHETSDAMRIELDELLGSLSDKVSDMRATLASAAEDGADALGNGARSLVKKTRKGVKELDKRWQKLDGKQKFAIAGGLLAVLAAAVAAPTVVRKVRAKH